MNQRAKDEISDVLNEYIVDKDDISLSMAIESICKGKNVFRDY
jgi:hypothetical protein